MNEQEEIIQKTNTGLIVPAEYRIADEEIERLSTIHLQALYGKANRRNNREYKIQDLGRKAQIMAALTIKCAVLIGKNLQEIKNYKIAQETIYKATGLLEMQTWLERQGGEKEKILATSGQGNTTQSYLQLDILSADNEKLFGNLGKFTSVVSELLKWLRIVATLNKYAKENVKLARLALLVGSTQKIWNQHRVYLTLIIGTILGKDKIAFEISDIVSLIKKLKEKNWEKELLDALRSIKIDGTSETLADDTVMRKIIVDLRNPEYYTLFYFLPKITFEKESERKLLNECRILMQDAMTLVFEQDYKDPARTKTGDSPYFREKLTNVLANKKVQIAYPYLLLHPYITTWLSDEELFRLTWFSKEDPIFENTVGVYDTDSRISTIYKKLNTPVLAKTIMDDIFMNDSLIGISYEFFVKNRSFYNNAETSNDPNEKSIPKSLTKSLESQMTKSILMLIIRTFNPWYFSKWLKETEMKSRLDDFKDLSKRKLLAAYFSTEDVERPQLLKNIVEQYAWIQYIDESTLRYFTKNGERKVLTKLKIEKTPSDSEQKNEVKDDEEDEETNTEIEEEESE